MSKKDKDDDTRIRYGTENIFADLGFPDPENHLLKAQLVTKIRHLLKAEKITQAKAAKRIGVSQPDVSRILKGEFRDYSVDRLMRFLTVLGCEVEIVVRPKGDTAAQAERFRVAGEPQPT